MEQTLKQLLKELKTLADQYATKDELFEIRTELNKYHKEILELIDEIEVRIVFAHQMQRLTAEDRLGRSKASSPVVGLPSTKDA